MPQWVRRLPLVLLGIMVVGSFVTTENLRLASAQSSPPRPHVAPGRTTPQPHDADQERRAALIARTHALIARTKRDLAQHRATLDELQALAPALQSRARSDRAWWPHDVQPDGPFCTMMGGFAAAVGRDRDAGWSLQQSLQTLAEIPAASLASVMQAIIVDLYSDPQLTPGLAQQVTEALCRQGIPPQY